MSSKLNKVISFGKYKHRTIREVAEIDPGYIVWVHQNVKSFEIPDNIAEACSLDTYISTGAVRALVQESLISSTIKKENKALKEKEKQKQTVREYKKILKQKGLTWKKK